MNIGIIGCGSIGNKRALTVKSPHKIIYLCDVNKAQAGNLSAKLNLNDVFITDNYKDVVSCPYVDIVIVSTIVKYLAPVTLSAVENNKHVIVEKPAGIKAEDLEPIIKKSKQNNLVVKVGFNHRYHPAMLKAQEIMKNFPDKLGDLMFIRGRYGHGGRVGYDKEWRANPELSGGGELIDQGVHLIDLSRWFLGDFSKVNGFAETFYWNMPVDDNAFMCLRTNDGKTAWLHVSCTEWKNIFSFEIYFKNAKFIIDGLGGSYGVERLSYYQMLPQMGPPETTIYEFPRGDESWQKEWEEVVNAIENKRSLTMGDISDAYEALKIVEKIYNGGNY